MKPEIKILKKVWKLIKRMPVMLHALILLRYKPMQILLLTSK